jgi:hypothetical protein
MIATRRTITVEHLMDTPNHPDCDMPDYDIIRDNNGYYWVKCPPQTCPVDLPHRIKAIYRAEITWVNAQYWRYIPAPKGDECRYYLHPVDGPGRGAFWACEVGAKGLNRYG